MFRGLYGQRHVIGHKTRRKGVEIGYTWSIGPSFGFLKPIYLKGVTSHIRVIVIDIEKYDYDKHNLNNIWGKAGGKYGFGELQFRPGLYLKFGMFVEYSKKQIGISGIEAGLALDIYPQKIEIMAVIENQQVFPL